MPEYAVTLDHPHDVVQIDHQVRRYDEGLVESAVTITNTNSAPVTVTQAAPLVLSIERGAHLLHWTSQWGAEFEPRRTPVTAPFEVGTTAGRSAHGAHPIVVVEHVDGRVTLVSIAWSGNWVVRLEPLSDSQFRLTAGMHDTGFAKTLAPGDTFESPRVVHITAPDLNTAAIALTQVGRTHWFPSNYRAEMLPIEWNHWWSYEDADIDDETFRRNVDVAAGIGVEVCTLDAGWFGPSDADSHWFDHRGDWDLVNEQRFPKGLRSLADYVHQSGMLFGLWCEIEAVGSRAALAEQHPDFLATRDGERLGYVCFGSPAVRDWAFATLERLILGHGADWIKLDFNLDPGLGCDRTDHGHGGGDGLYEHYRGYYATLDRLRAAYPTTVLETCSSGGLRLDLELLRHVDVTFLSDPDWPEHGLQLLWAATLMLPPNRLLHWGFSQWRGHHPRQDFDPHTVSPTQLDYYRRIAMLGATGCSLKLPDLPGWVRDRLAMHHRFYRDVVRRFVQQGEVRRLTDQPQRDGAGSRWAGFQYSIGESDEHLVFVFRLDGGTEQRVLRLGGLQPDRDYRVVWQDAAIERQITGAQLMADGVEIDTVPVEGSEILLLQS